MYLEHSAELYDSLGGSLEDTAKEKIVWKDLLLRLIIQLGHLLHCLVLHIVNNFDYT